MKVIFVVPVPGKTCPHPAGGDDLRVRMVPEGGVRVRDDSYWRRRVAEGVVTLGEPPEPKSDEKGA